MSMFELVIREPSQPERRVELTSTIDAGREVDGLVLADEQVSRRHLRFTVADDRLTVEDLGSTNGTNVNGNRWGWGATTMTMFHTVVPPNSRLYAWNSCRDGCGGCGPDDSTFSNAQSNHAGGVNVAMGDGSVRFVKDTIARQTWMAIGTKSNSEAVSADSY